MFLYFGQIKSCFNSSRIFSMEKKISVIVPVYQAELFLDQCVTSIMNQTFSNFELLLVDDGSFDRSPILCDDWAKRDSRIKVIHKPNGGVSSARNVGIDAATGEYLCFVDSDDTLPKDALYNLYVGINECDSDIAVGSFQYQYGEKLVYHANKIKKGIYNISTLMNDFIDDGTLSGFLLGSVCVGIYRMHIIKKYLLRFAEGLKNNEDGLFNFEYCLVSNTISVIDSIVYNYRQDDIPLKPIRKNEDYGKKVFDFLDKKEWQKDLYHYEIQKARRNVTLAWWDILNFALDYPFFRSLSFIWDSLSREDVRNGIKYMCPNKMNRYKLILFYLMKYRLCLTIYCLLRFVVPEMRKRFAR